MNPQLTQKVYSVSELTEKIKRLLEDNFPMIWIYGEISNIRIPASGHAYFTLKDQTAQISAVMFKGQLRNLKFKLEDGFTISGLGRISLYEPRGTYQIILEYAEPRGVGALQIAFEQLKRKLSQEGLFDQIHKKPLPFLPECISVITSPTGAVIQDILNVMQRRFPGIKIEICPVRVQGDAAPGEIVRAIELVNDRATSDVIILARGGGSLEDLAPFNSEIVARAIFSSNIPMVSAVGHETDYTIADFVADLRAPTPSAAAELVTPSRSALLARCAELQQRCVRSLIKMTAYYRGELEHLRRALVHPSKRVQELQLRVDDLSDQLNRMMRFFLRQQASCLAEIRNKLLFHNPQNRIELNKQKVDILSYKISESMNIYLNNARRRISICHTALVALSPQSILERGYSITRTVPDQAVVRSAAQVRKGQRLEVLLAHGKIEAITD